MSNKINPICFLSMQRLLEDGGKIVELATVGERIHDSTETSNWNNPSRYSKPGRGWEIFYNDGEKINARDSMKNFDNFCAFFAPSEATHFFVGNFSRLDHVSRNISWAITEHYREFTEVPVIYLKSNPARNQRSY